ncbi:uncharacterized protein [Musca autumnalis]|uniref:uncharacterized protein n=1 Tax=Musca autumnalis TaxID=221902 RepID=UPI003CEDA77C
MSEILLGRICRTCLRESSIMHKLLSMTEAGHLSIEEMLHQVVPDCNVVAEDLELFLPVEICEDCLNKLTKAYDFHQMCIESNKKLRDLRVRNVRMPVEIALYNPNENMERDDDDLINTIAIETVKLSVEIEQDNRRENMERYNNDPMDTIAIETENDLLKEIGFEAEKNENSDNSFNNNRDDDSSSADVDDNDDEEWRPNVEASNVSSLNDKIGGDISSVDENDEEWQQDVNDSNVSTFNDKMGDDDVSSEDEDDEEDKNKYKFTCTECHKKFEFKTSFNWHKRVHNPDHEFVCQICQYRFASKMALKSHITTKHDPKRPKKMHACNICDFQIDKLTVLTIHLKRYHRDVLPVKCELCDVEFLPTDAHREYHMTVHREISCDICKATFKTRKDLRYHTLKNHVEKSPYLCPHCGKEFRQSGNLYQHVQIHKEKNIQCPECPKRFNFKNKLKLHMLTHTKEKKFVCKTCGEAFLRPETLNTHRKKHSKDYKAKIYQCTQCNMSFTRKFTLERHQITHTGEKKHQCTHCDRVFAASGDLVKHLRTHLGENTYMCDECPQAFKYQKELRDHKSQHYKEKNGVVGSHEKPAEGITIK